VDFGNLVLRLEQLQELSTASAITRSIRAARREDATMTDDRVRPKGAIEKAFALLAELQSEGAAVRLSELGRRLGLPKSTAHRTLRILVESGLVAQSGNRYQAVFTGRGDVDEPIQIDLWRKLAPFVCDVLVRTGLTTSLAVLDGTDVTFVYRAYAHDNVRTGSDYSGRSCAYATAAGQLLMAFDQDAMRHVIAARALDADDVAELNDNLFTIRRQCFKAKQSANGLTCVAVPMLGTRGLPRVALTVRGATRRLDIDHIVYVLRRVAAAATSAVLQPSPGTYKPAALKPRVSLRENVRLGGPDQQSFDYSQSLTHIA
jgi:DNA-binding IclR family transcriptional regulator